jgi:hypothetical protein
VKAREPLGAHGVVLEVADPDREARLWRRALGLPVLRRRRGEVVLGSVAFFVRLKRSASPTARVSEVHVAVEEMSGAGVAEDALGGRSRALELAGLRLFVRKLEKAPSREWLPKRRRARKR